MNESARAVWLFLAAFLQQHRYPPSQAEIAEGTHYSRASVSYALAILEAREIIKRYGKPRALVLLQLPENWPDADV